MSKAIIMIDIPTDYADEYKQWIIEGTLYYLEDGAWTVLKDVQYGVELYKDAIPIEWIEEYRQNREDYADEYNAKAVLKRLLETWEKENEFV